MNHDIKMHRWNLSRRSSFFGLALLLWLIAPLTWAQSTLTTAIASGAVVDASTERVFLLELEQLTARSMETGELYWAIEERIEPLGVSDGQLVALRESATADQAQLLTIDPAQGAVLSSRELSFPEGVRARLMEGPGERFQARLQGDGSNLQLAWDYTRHPLQGAPAIAGLNRAPKMPRETVLVTETPDPADEAPMAERVVLSDYRSGVIDLSGDWTGPNASAQPVEASSRSTTQWQELHGADRVSGPAGRQFQSASSASILVSTPVESESAAGRYLWTVLDGQNQPIGQYESDYSFAPFARVDDRLAFITFPDVRFDGERVIASQARALIVIDLANGREAWQAALLDKAWREGMPP